MRLRGRTFAGTVTVAARTVCGMANGVAANQLSQLIGAANGKIVNAIARAMRADNQALNVTIGRNTDNLAALIELYGNPNHSCRLARLGVIGNRSVSRIGAR
jgi:hypothetical protein